MIYYICDRKRKIEHCHEYCLHGRPHKVEGCSIGEICYIGNKKGTEVKCRMLNKKEMKLYKEYITFLIEGGKIPSLL